ncbi:MAG: adenylate/guanylate cyclase domain-containing protein [Leptospiraceae bacterium]|nr:adenylate/guanylate cyclase domain-containing protein [Leptospiraceae bacterium]
MLIRRIWKKLVFTEKIQNLHHTVLAKREIIFNKLLFIGISQLVLVILASLVIGLIAYLYLNILYTEHLLAYILTSCILMFFLALLYRFNNKSPSHIFKILAYILAHTYIVILCLYSGPGPRIEMLIFSLLPLPYFVMDRENKFFIIAGILISSFFLGLIFFFYYKTSALYPLPPIFDGSIFFIAILFNLSTISICSYQFFLETFRAEEALQFEQEKSEELLLNILPRELAIELKEGKRSKPRRYDYASVLFTDFVGFTRVSQKLSPEDLVSELDDFFSKIDSILEEYGIEKLKTIGDAYMCAAGIPNPSPSHAVDCILLALKIVEFSRRLKKIRIKQGKNFWELRIGIHSGPLVAGVIGQKKFAYDVWGDTVNTASRMESTGESGEINISDSTYELVKDFFVCEPRGKLYAKNKGWIEMYFVKGIHPNLSLSKRGKTPNEKFMEKYKVLGFEEENITI